MVLAKVSLLINTVVAILALASREGQPGSGTLVLGLFLFALIAAGMAFLRRWEETGSRRAAYAALASFALFFPIGLIGVFGARRLLRMDAPDAAARKDRSILSSMTVPLMLAALAGLLMLGCFMPYFWSARNLMNLGPQLLWPVLIGFAVLPAALNGDLDLASPWIAGFAGIVIAQAVQDGSSPAAGLGLALAAALVLGSLSGALAAAAGLPAFAATLAVGAGIQAFSYAATNGDIVKCLDFPGFPSTAAGALALMVLGGLLCFGFGRLSALLRGTTAKRFAAFLAGAAIAVLAGFCQLSRLRAAGPAYGGNTAILALAVFFWIRSFGPRIAGRWGFLLAPAAPILVGLMGNLSSLGGAAFTYQLAAQAMLAILLMLVSGWDAAKRPDAWN